MELFWQAMKLFLLMVFFAPLICFADQQAKPLEALVVASAGFGFEKGGEPAGIGVDIFYALNRVVDIDIKPVVTPATEINKRLVSGNFDLALMYKRDALSPGVFPIGPVVSVSYLQISTKPFPTIESLAQSRAGFLEVGSLSPELQNTLVAPQFYESISSGYQALERGDIDVLIGTRSNMSSGVESLNTLQTEGLFTRSFVSTEIFIYSRTGLLAEHQITQLREAIKAMRETNMIRQIRRYYMSESAKL